MATNEPYYLDAVNSRGMGVRVTFEWTRDRYSHTIYGIRKGHADAVANSVEDERFDEWPLSPPIQELRESLDSAGQRTLLLMGSAAYGHWSATARVEHFDAENPYVEFDVAVRLHRSPAYLGVAYDTLNEATWTGMPGGLAFIHCEPHALVIAAPLGSIEVDSPAPTDLLKAFPAPDMPNRRWFLPAAPLPAQYPATFRWQYCVASAFA
jgi:hypothetical protein